MEGLNLGGYLLGFLGIGVLGLTSLVALGLLIARKTAVARIVFATGLLLAAVIVAVAALSFLDGQFHGDEVWPQIMLVALILLMSATGQFVAALRRPRTYGAALACTAGAMVLLWVPALQADFAAIVISWRDLSPAALRFAQEQRLNLDFTTPPKRADRKLPPLFEQ